MKLFKVIWSFCFSFLDSPLESDSQVLLPDLSNNDVLPITEPYVPEVTSKKKTFPCRQFKKRKSNYGNALIPVWEVLCNDKDSRRSWHDGYNISTNYEDVTQVPDTGVVRNYTLVLTNAPWKGDGYLAEAMLFNGTYPGPLIEGNWGDTFNITVINNLTNDNGTAIHWHGIRQFNNGLADGVPGVTQCPIPPRQTMNYVFKATQYGTSWYHSHFSLQYGDGLAGPMVIHGPTSANYDEDLGVFMISDWYHDSAFQKNFRAPSPPISKLINGVGNFTIPWGFKWKNQTFYDSARACDPATDLRCYPHEAQIFSATKLDKKKKYKLRIINSSVGTHYTWWVEKHIVTVVAADFVPVEPYNLTTLLNIGIGQRYDVIVQLKPEYVEDAQNDFWINLRNCDRRCIGSTIDKAGNSTCPFPKKDCNDGKKWDECRQAFLRYNTKSPKIPPRRGEVEDPGSQECQDERMWDLKPEVRKAIPDKYIDVKNASLIGLEVYDGWDAFGNTFFHWVIHKDTFKLDWSKPSFGILESGHNIDDPHYSSFPVPKEQEWMVLIIDGNYTVFPGHSNHSIDDPNRVNHRPAGRMHPIHLHGHDFMILAQELPPKSKIRPTTEEIIAKVKENKLKWGDQFPRRDTALLPDSGYLVIAWKNDNPGAWLLHCHIAWHVSNGFAMQFIERQSEIVPQLKASGKWPQYVQQCKDWGVFSSHTWTESHDSGV